MGLLTETNEQYYAGQQAIVATGVASPAEVLPAWTGDTTLLNTTDTSFTNFKVKLNNVVLATTAYSMVNNIITLIGTATVAGDVVVIELLDNAKWANNGGYEYISLTDVINNFMVAYVGMDKLIPRAKRTDIIFHAKRGLQEFSYDTLKSIKSQELTIPPSLSVIIPQDYVNYVEMSRIDGLGVKHIIYPTRLTSNPYTVPVQDNEGTPTQDTIGNNLESTSITNERWDTTDDNLLTGAFSQEMFNAGVYNWRWDDVALGRRYGLDPEVSQTNGWFTMNEREGKISFSSNLAGQLIILEYISDGLSVDYDMRIPKMAEEAIYMHIAYSMLASRMNIPEYIVARYKKDRRAALRNAKIRLSNIKLEEFTQIMRGKSKWIKH
tara:strand:+ start:13396 stop:14535 length:1140 start_codon:yes stop_codon:yes gene_type:complete